MKALLICFTGIDGTGKTTLARWAGEFLAKQGINTRYVWGSYEERLAHPLVSLGQRLFVRKNKNNYHEYHGSVTEALGNSFVAASYQGLTLSEYLGQVFFSISVPLAFGHHVIADRYIYDTFLNLAVNSRQTPEELKTKINRFLRWCRTPDIVFHLDASPEVVMKRKNDIPALEYEEKRRQLYTYLAKEFGFVSINAQGTMDEVRRQTQERLEKLLKERK